MSVDNAILFTFVTLLSLNIVSILATECVPQSPCSCKMQNGESYDISNIAEDKFISSPTVSNRTFYFHPCSNKIFSLNNTSINTSGCSSASGISLCLYDATANVSTNLGTAEESSVTLVSNLPQMIFKHGKDADLKTVTIDLICNLQEKAPTVFLEYSSGSTPPKYNLVLVSRHACKKAADMSGLSTGSVLVIILLVFSGIYFAGGAVALKLLRGATGWEMLPNHKFWFDFPALVRDGVAFTFNGCKVVSYDQI